MNGRYSKQEQIAMGRRQLNLIDPYPEIEQYHQNPFLRYLDKRNLDYLIERKTRTKKIDSAESVQAYIADIRSKFKQMIELPSFEGADRAFVTRTIDKGSYLIDAVLIESVPGVFVTANFYYPKNVTSPIPGVLMMCGHALDGKASTTYVSLCVEAAASGMCALVFDPIGQGERKMRDFRPDSEEEWFDPVSAHCVVDRQLSLVGEHTAQYMMLDNVRALDYMLSRPEVDSSRIAATGNSGGGTMSAFMGAYDDRIHVVAPSCYITELRALLHRILAQDAEQCLPGFMEQGLGIGDFVIAAAPKPYFIGSALCDFFPIDGTRDAFIEAKRMYRLLGQPDNLDIYTSQQGHGFWHDIRENALKFMSRHFGIEWAPDAQIDYDALPTEEELICAFDDASRKHLDRDIQDFIREMGSNRYGQSNALRQGCIRDSVLETLKIDVQSLDVQIVRREPSRIEYTSESGMHVFASLDENAKSSSNKVLIHVGERTHDAQFPGGEEYKATLYVEPRGTGEGSVHPRSSFGIFDVESGTYYNIRMLGGTLQGMRVLDVLAGINVIRSNPAYESSDIVLYGREEHALTALYAVIIAGDCTVQLDGLLGSFRSLVDNKSHLWGTAIIAERLLDSFDIDDLISAMPEGAVRIGSKLDAMKNEK